MTYTKNLLMIFSEMNFLIMKGASYLKSVTLLIIIVKVVRNFFHSLNKGKRSNVMEQIKN